MQGLLWVDYGFTAHAFLPEERVGAHAVARLIALAVERERLVHDRAQALATANALREANQRMEEMLSITGHEIRTPLTALKGSIQLADRRLRNRLERAAEGRDMPSQAPDPTREILGGMVRQIDRLNLLVDELLDVSRIRAGKLALRVEATELTALVRRVVEEQQLAWPTRTISFAPVGAVPVPVAVDPRRIEQVLANYLANALKYSPDDRPVSVWLDVGESEVRVCVRDQGPGVPENEQERIWERYHQIEGIPQLNGTGVGLYLCREIIEQHAGRVGVESTQGEGATFWCALPTNVSAHSGWTEGARDGERYRS